MWTTAEIVAKDAAKGGFLIGVLYSTDDVPPVTETHSIFIAPGQDGTTLQAAIVQQLADLNDQDKNKNALIDLGVIVDAIPLGVVKL